jgi:hypothetical protein
VWLAPPYPLGESRLRATQEAAGGGSGDPPAILPKLLPQNRKVSAVFLQSFRKWRVRLGRFLQRPWRRNKLRQAKGRKSGRVCKVWRGGVSAAGRDEGGSLRRVAWRSSSGLGPHGAPLVRLGSCSASFGSGYRSRQRGYIRAETGGEVCEGLMEDFQNCDLSPSDNGGQDGEDDAEADYLCLPGLSTEACPQARSLSRRDAGLTSLPPRITNATSPSSKRHPRSSSRS